MALDEATIDQQRALLSAHRRTLNHLLQQAAQFSAGHIPAHVANGITAARAEIGRIKVALRREDVEVEDEPGDEASSAAEPAQVQPDGGDEIASGDISNSSGGAIGRGAQNTMRKVDTQGGDYAEGNIDNRQGAFINQSTIYGDVIGQKTVNYYQPAISPLDRQHRRNRRAMLAKVKKIWITDFLEHSLAKELRIALNLTEHPDAVELPLNALVQELNRPARPLPTGTPIIEVFEQMDGALLILGAPGAGKTTLLLELARDLIACAEGEEEHPIPVVFNLSSWAANRQSLKAWLVEELNQRYNVPCKIGQEWIDTDALLLLLDGLDEVAEQHRAACVTAINDYRQQQSMSPLAVCSRVADYEALTVRLRLQGAIVVQSLTEQQVDTYLERTGEKLAGVRGALHSDRELREMLDTPLMLSIVALAYAGKTVTEIEAARPPGERREYLFDAYIETLFKRRSRQTRYSQQQTTARLSWLAGKIMHQRQTIYYIERMQPDWLSPKQQRWYAICVRLLVKLLRALLLGLVMGLLIGLPWGPLTERPLLGLLMGSVLGLLLGLFFHEMGDNFEHITIVEALRPSRSVDTLASELFFGAPFGLFVGLLSSLRFGLFLGTFVGLVAWLLFGLFLGLVGTELAVKATPNQGIHQSARNWLLLGVLFGLLGGLTSPLAGWLISDLGFGLAGGLVVGFVIGLLFGLLVGLFKGGLAVIQHYTLRWFLSCDGSLPLHLVPFLNYCVERIFLRKVGGGYIFIHRLLMEHFAGQTQQSEGRNAPEIEPVQAVERSTPNLSSIARIIPGLPRGKHQTWICSSCGGFVRQDAVLCKHCKSYFCPQPQLRPQPRLGLTATSGYWPMAVGIIVIALGLGAIGMSFLSLQSQQGEYEALRGGPTVQGRVIDKRIREFPDSDPLSGTTTEITTYIFVYQYEVGTAQYAGESTVANRATYDQIRIGNSIDVRYAANNPTIHCVSRGCPFAPDVMFNRFLYFLPLIGLVVLWYGWRRHQTARQLISQGQIALATITDRWIQEDIDKEGTKALRYCITYQFDFSGPDGENQRIVRSENNKLAYDRLAVGAETTVRFLPAEPQICMLEVA